MVSVMKGMNGARARTRVNRTSNRVFSAAKVSSTPPEPFRRLLLNRMYQFVVFSNNSSSLGTTVSK